MADRVLKSWRELDAESRARWRFDFVTEVASFDDELRVARLVLTPDPRRYTVSSIDGDKSYVDKFLGVLIPEDIVLDLMAAHLSGLPVSFDPPSIASSEQYAKSRRVALEDELGGGSYLMPAEPARLQGELNSSNDSFISFISLDIVGSTALRHLHGVSFDRSYEYFMRELVTVVGQFRGSILKATGDGFLAFIDLPGFTTQCDNTVDLGLTLKKIVSDSINPSLKKAGLLEFRVRIGADVGGAVKRAINVEATQFRSYDIGSAALNRAVKIEQVANAGQFLIGQALYELIHVGWLERCRPVAFDGTTIGAPGYRVFEVV